MSRQASLSGREQLDRLDMTAGFLPGDVTASRVAVLNILARN